MKVALVADSALLRDGIQAALRNCGVEIAFAGSVVGSAASVLRECGCDRAIVCAALGDPVAVTSACAMLGGVGIRVAVVVGENTNPSLSHSLRARGVESFVSLAAGREGLRAVVDTWERGSRVLMLPEDRAAGPGTRRSAPVVREAYDAAILRELAAGLRYSAVAERVRLGERTVHRRVNRMMQRARVATPFQLGWHTGRVGLDLNPETA